MELVDSYLTELRHHLPSDQREDIVKELRDNIVEEVHERAAERDGEPDVTDERAVLTKLGHPLKVAGAYKTRRYLIGPDLYPAYLQTLRDTLLIGFFVVFGLRVAGGFQAELGLLVKGLLGQFVEIGLWIIGIVSAIFLGLESSGEKLRWFHDWTPDALSLKRSPVDVSGTASNLVFEGFFLLYWNSAVSLDWGLDERWLSAINLASVWHSLYWPANLIIGAFFVLHCVVLLRGHWMRWSARLELALCVGLLALIGIVLGAQPLVVVEPNLASEADFPSPAWLNRTLYISLLVVAGLTVWDGVLAYRRSR